jgi:hypothetical protein
MNQGLSVSIASRVKGSVPAKMQTPMKPRMRPSVSRDTGSERVLPVWRIVIAGEE